ncbi:uncharacterized protein LOC143237825 isoform X2 [Tachypleus tridentatus]
MGEAGSLEEISSHTILKFGVTKQEQDENYNKTVEKTENTLYKVKTEQPDYQQDDVISEFSNNSDDDLDSSNYNVVNVKTETELQEHLQQIESRLESSCDIKTGVNIYCGHQFPNYELLKQEDFSTEVIKSQNQTVFVKNQTIMKIM